MLTASLPLVKVGLPGLRPASRRPGRSWSAPRRLAQRLVCQAGGGADGGNGGGPEPPSNSKDEEKTKRIKEVEANLKQLGIDRSTAKRVLEIWKQAGATSPESLRNLFVKRSLSKSVTLLVQLALDVLASGGAFYTGVAIGQSNAFGTYTLAIQYLAYFLGMYLALSASLDLFGLVALQVATARYSANADAFLLAVQELAGRDAASGLDVVDKARKAVSMVKVLQALQSILDMLQDQKAASREEFFDSLAAYLTLERAQRLYRFDAAAYNLTEAQAAEIATVFARFDTDDNGVLDVNEFRKLCAETAPHLAAEEVEAALGVLDTDSSGAIDFGEWVQWWVSRGQPQKGQPQEQAAQ